MKTTNGDDKPTQIEEMVQKTYLHDTIPGFYERTVIKVAAGNLFLQREIEQQVELARDEHSKLLALMEKLDAKISDHSAERSCSPPAVAAFLLAFIAPKNTVQAFLGDLEEVFHKNAARLGERQARRQYWMQVFASLGPLAWQCLKRIGFLTVLVDYVRAKLGV